jgi:hypothetical protein
LSHPDGMIVASVTASKDEGKRISWNKAREVLGTGAGMNPINYVCIGRPGFHSLAERKAEEIAREEGGRRLLLMPVDVIAEAVVRVREEALEPVALADLLARAKGLLTLRDLEPAPRRPSRRARRRLRGGDLEHAADRVAKRAVPAPRIRLLEG